MKKIRSGKCILLCLVMLTLHVVAVAEVIRISSVEELYSAVNNPANTGAALVLARGTYMLSAIDPNGALRPNGGRIELQMNMSIVGVIWNRDAVVIDASGLPLSSFPPTENGVATGPSAAIRMGLGYNVLEWLTVRNAVNAGANIDTGLQAFDPGTAFIRVAHVASTGSARGLNIQNFGPPTSGQTIEADIIERLEQEQVDAELTDADSPRGIQLAENYDILGRPAVALIRDDGTPVQVWQGVDDLPTPSDVGYLAHQ